MLLGTVFVSGCSQTLAPPAIIVKNEKVVHCYGFKKIDPTAQDVQVISDHLAIQLLQHNRYGAKIKCWKSPK